MDDMAEGGATCLVNILNQDYGSEIPMMKTMMYSTVVRTSLLVLFAGSLSAVASAQAITSDKMLMFAAAVRAVANAAPAKPGDLIVSTRIGSSEDEKAANRLAAELGGRARSRANRFVCAEDAVDPRRKPICRVEAGQQFVEIVGLEETGSSSLVSVRLETNTRRGVKMELFRVTLVPEGHKWRVASSELVEIS